MSLPDRELLELNELCQALIDGALSEPDRARLEERLAGSEEARRFYVRTMALSASLFEYAGEMQSEAPEIPRPVPAYERPARGLWWTIGSLAAAALLVVGLWFGQRAARQEGDTLAAAHESDDVVARLSGARDGRWTGSPLSAGEELHRGQHIQLASGLAEIAFDSGAIVVLEGPASLELTSEWEAILQRGTLKAQVPPEAIGFRVSNAAVEVVDLGTEFSMVADDQGATEVFVTKGSVETRIGGTQPLVLRETEARRFGGAGDFVVHDREQKLRRLARLIALERFPRPLSFAHWSFDEAKGDTVAAERSGFASGDFQATLADAPDRLTEGRFERALRLGGESFAKIDLSGAGQEAVRTAAFWIKVPAEAPLPEAGPMLAWWLPGNRDLEVEIAWNSQPAQGPLGALRTSIGRGLSVGTTSVRDGQWHHIAVVLTPGRRVKEIQVQQYVDGRLDGVSNRRAIKRNHFESAPRDRLLWLGRSSEVAGAQFRGEIDELFIANRALSPQEIKQLMRENRITPAPTVAALD